MNIYIKVDGVRYPVTLYSYRLNSVDSATKVSHILSVSVVAKNATIIAGSTIEFFSDDVLIYSDPINEVIKNEHKFTIRSEKTINIPVAKNVIVEDLFFYSSLSIRAPSNFDIIPLDTIYTDVGNFVAYTVVHHDFTTEVTIGQS